VEGKGFYRGKGETDPILQGSNERGVINIIVLAEILLMKGRNLMALASL